MKIQFEFAAKDMMAELTLEPEKYLEWTDALSLSDKANGIGWQILVDYRVSHPELSDLERIQLCTMQMKMKISPYEDSEPVSDGMMNFLRETLEKTHGEK